MLVWQQTRDFYCCKQGEDFILDDGDPECVFLELLRKVCRVSDCSADFYRTANVVLASWDWRNIYLVIMTHRFSLSFVTLQLGNFG
jgi:hypothetical protein